MRKVLLVVFMGMISFFSFSQSHNVKLNATALIGWRVPELQYEFSVNRIGVQFGVGAMIPRGTKFLSRFDVENQLQDGETSLFTNMKMTGFRLTPEVKFYLGDADAPQGFYISTFARYYRYSLKSDYSQVISGNLESVKHLTSFSSFGAGLGMGTQWVINDKVSIDILWLGVGITKGKINLDLDSSFDSDGWEEVENEWKADAAKSEFDFIKNSEITRDENGVAVKMDNPMPVILRSSISIGYVF